MARRQSTGNPPERNLEGLSEADLEKVAADFGVNADRLAQLADSKDGRRGVPPKPGSLYWAQFADLYNGRRSRRPKPSRMKAELRRADAAMFGMSEGTLRFLCEALNAEMAELDAQRREFEAQHPDNYKKILGSDTLQAIRRVLSRTIEQVDRLSKQGEKGYLPKEILYRALCLMQGHPRPYRKHDVWHHLETARHVRDGLAAMGLVKPDVGIEAVAATLARASSGKTAE